MKKIDFYFDVVSPYAFLAFERLPQALAGLSVSVDYRPVLFAGMLAHWGQKGPAEIEPKRAWTFRQIAWQANALGIALQTPAQHPFNPLALMRLAHACALEDGTPNRFVCEALFHHVWHGGADPNEPARLAELARRVTPRLDPLSPDVKQALRDATAAAVGRGVFGVPTFAVDGRLFWGLDSIPMLVACLQGDPWFDGPGWEAPRTAISGVVRAERPTRGYPNSP
jgi:2-hydroxychromene-2-carboxylate isomerase